MEQTQEYGLQRKSYYRKKARPYAVFLYIWGAQWMIAGVLGFFSQWRDLESVERISFYAAVLLSLLFSLFGKRSLLRRTSLALLGTVTLCVLMLIGTVMILDYVQAVDPFFVPLLHGFVLAIGYAFVSMYLGRPLLYLSLWMFALTAVIALRYLGYSTMLLEGFGGLSMVFFAWLIGFWNRGRRRRKKIRAQRKPLHAES
ncbi:hypothetical protein [Paenibacillus hamazuiensis]|uniref:hypothetical protein n=1 Tax=Paenibacillus hamazuiensis TaxID=2936508 RepID=UPI00200E53A8|nr:hypothetical protein [Paenibacillus hamazuiensis]